MSAPPASRLDKVSDLSDFAIEYVLQLFSCDGALIAIQRPNVGRDLHTLAERGLRIDPARAGELSALVERVPRTPGQLQLVSRTRFPGAGADPWACLRPACEGRRPSVAVVIGQSNGGDRYLVGVTSGTMSEAAFEDLLASRIGDARALEACVRGLVSASHLSGVIDALQNGYDALRFGTLFVDETSRVIFINGCARRLLSAAYGGVFRGRGGGDGRWAGPAATLFIASLVAAFRAETQGHDGAVTIWRHLPHLEEKLPFCVMKFEPGRDQPGAYCIVFPDQSQPIAPEIVLKGLGLTSSETKLAAHIILGRSLRDASDDLSLSEESARTYLKRVFSKLGISRQAELVSKVANLCAPVRSFEGDAAEGRGDEGPTDVRRRHFDR